MFDKFLYDAESMNVLYIMYDISYMLHMYRMVIYDGF